MWTKIFAFDITLSHPTIRDAHRRKALMSFGLRQRNSRAAGVALALAAARPSPPRGSGTRALAFSGNKTLTNISSLWTSSLVFILAHVSPPPPSTYELCLASALAQKRIGPPKGERQ